MAKQELYNFNDLTKSQQDCLTLIQSLGIYELRALARVFGDNSPTTLKRNDHISIVMDKIISGEELRPIPLRQGRPYKELSNIEGILAELSQITGKDYSIKNNQAHVITSRSVKTITFKQIEEDIIKQKLFPIQVKGVLCERNENEYFFINQDNSKSILVKKNDYPLLKPADYIVGTAVVMNEDKEYILDSLNFINFQSYTTYQDINNPYQTHLPTQKFQIFDQDLLLGSRYIIKNTKITENVEKLKKLLTKLNENKILTLSLLTNILPENMLTIESIAFNNNFIIKYDDRPQIALDTLTNLIENIKRLQEQGFKIAVFVDDITTLANQIDCLFKNESKTFMGHTETAVETIKKLIMLAKAGGENKHTTLFCTYDDADMFDQMFTSSVYKISKKFDIN